MILSLVSGSASQARTAPYSAEYSRENAKSSFGPGLSCPVLCPGNSFPWSHWALRSIAVTCGVCWLHLSAPSLCHSLETLKALIWGTTGLASFVSCLSEITVLHCLRSNFLKSVVVYTFEFFGCFMQESESPLCYSILSKADIYWLALGRHGPLTSA